MIDGGGRLSIGERKTKTVAVILAGGSGVRMGLSIPKQRLTIAGKSLLLRSAMAFDACEGIDGIIVVSRFGETEYEYIKKELSSVRKLIFVVEGGKSRAESAKCGFCALPVDVDFVAIHDAARPLITPEEITNVLNAAYVHGAATACAPVNDTVKQVGADGLICGTVPRERLRAAQTPQIFSTALYKKALEFSAESLSGVTDDNVLFERIGVPVYAVDIGSTNIKITTQSDLEYAEFLLSKREESYV